MTLRIQRDEHFRDLRAGYFEQVDRDKLAQRLVRRLRGLGFEVDVQPTLA